MTEQWNSGKHSRVLTIGTFDPFTAGHADLLKWCYRLGDEVIVGVLSDEFVTKNKGKPTFDQRFRLSQVTGLVDHAYIEFGRKDGTHPDNILHYHPHFVVVGGDWHQQDYMARMGLSQVDLDFMGIAVVYSPRIGISSTEIKNGINQT